MTGFALVPDRRRGADNRRDAIIKSDNENVTRSTHRPEARFRTNIVALTLALDPDWSLIYR